MATYTREDIQHTPEVWEKFDWGIRLLRQVMPLNTWMVFRFDEAPDWLSRVVSMAGGDEDCIIVAPSSKSELADIGDWTDSSMVDVYTFESRYYPHGCRIFVKCH